MPQANDLKSTCWGSIPRHLPTSSNVPKLRKGTIIITMMGFYCVHNNYIGILTVYYHLYKRNINDLGQFNDIPLNIFLVLASWISAQLGKKSF